MEDSEILDLYRQRSERAIAETAAKYGNYCGAIAHRILQNEEDTEECLSDTWLHAWNAIPPDEPKPFSVYLGRLTRWIGLSRLRDRNRLRRGGGEATLALEELDATLASSFDTQSIVEYHALGEALNRFLAELPDTERKVFLCRYWYLAGIEEIAGRFGFSRAKVKSMLLRSRRKLKQQLLEEGYL